MIFPNSKICLWDPYACSAALRPAVKRMTSLISKAFRKVSFPLHRRKSHTVSWVEIFVDDCNFPSGWGFLPWHNGYLKVISHYFLKPPTTVSIMFFEGLNLCLEKKFFSYSGLMVFPPVFPHLLFTWINNGIFLRTNCFLITTMLWGIKCFFWVANLSVN